MKNSNFTRFASFLLAIGFFVSCSSSKFSVDPLIEEGNYDQALTELNQEIEKNPSAELYFQKGKIHGLIAEDSESTSRPDQYNLMNQSFDSVSTYQSNPEVDNSIRIDSIKSYYWNLEHQAGLRAYRSENNSSLASSHFENAILILPSKVDSYRSLSIVQYENEEIDQAINTLENAIELDIADTQTFESLGFLYLETGDPQKSISNYRKANQDPSDNKNIAFGLVNAFISNGQTSEAISFLRNLVEKYPNETKLNNALGTQLYIQLEPLFGQLKTAYSNSDSTRVTNLRVEIEGLSEQAESELINAYQAQSENVDYIESLAVFYNNMSGNYFSLIDVAFESDKLVIQTKALELTDFAINYYNTLSNISDSGESYSDKIETLQTLKNSWTNQE